jgi:hypothetical protein
MVGSVLPPGRDLERYSAQLKASKEEAITGMT